MAYGGGKIADVVELDWPASSHASVGIAGGGWVVVWLEESDNVATIGTQRYDAAGKKVGSPSVVAEVLVATDPLQNMVVSAVDAIALADGGWLITWGASTDAGLGDELFQQRYSAAGVKVGEPVMVNTTTLGMQKNASVVELDGGGWITTWISQGDTADQREALFQRFDVQGNKIGTEQHAGSSNLVLAALDDGGWIASWAKLTSENERSIFQQRYDGDGKTVGGVTEATKLAAPAGQISSVGLEEGGWVTTWVSYDGSNTSGYLKAFDANGGSLFANPIKLGSPIAINVNKMAVAALSHGGWAVAWYQWPGDDVFVQVFEKNGNAQKIERVTTEGGPEAISISGLENGAFVVSWDSGDWDIQQRRFEGHNLEPSGKDKAITINEDATYRFKLADFGYSDRDGDSLAGIKITVLPKNGSLVLDGRVVKAGDVVGVAEIAKLAWTPGANTNGAALAKVAFRVVDDGGTFNGGANTDQTTNYITFSVNPVLDIIKGNNKANNLVGTQDADVLLGYGGNDVLNGGKGADKMEGGYGDDIYYVDNAKDVIGANDTAGYGEGFDTVRASVSYVLKEPSVEKLVLIGSKDIDAVSVSQFVYGNSGRNTLKGTSYDQRIYGRDGDDRLISLHNDKLSGGSGSDTFVKNFNAHWQADILDFDPRGSDHDRIELHNVPARLTFSKLKASYMEQDGKDVVIVNGEGYEILTLKNVALSDLDASDFLL